MYQQFKSQIKRSFFAYNAYLYFCYHLFWIDWLRHGKPVPTPHFVKQKSVLEYGRRFNLPVLIETGTYQRGMVLAQALGADAQQVLSLVGLAADIKPLKEKYVRTI